MCPSSLWISSSHEKKFTFLSGSKYNHTTKYHARYPFLQQCSNILGNKTIIYVYADSTYPIRKYTDFLLRRVICAPKNYMTMLAASLLITESAYLARQLWEHSCRRSFPLGCYGLIVGQSEGLHTNNIPQQYNASLWLQGEIGNKLFSCGAAY